MIESPANYRRTKKNKSYPNSTIAESLCEIHFDCNPSQNLAVGTILRSIKNELGSDYPSVTEQQIKQFQAAITEMGISVNEEKSGTTRLIFKHRERNHMIQFLPNILTINEVKQYPGWDYFLQDVFRGWTALNSVFTSIFAKRISLRYINLVSRRNPLEPLSAWLKPNIYYPNAILNCSSKFLARNEFDLGNNVRLILTLAEPVRNEIQGNFIFDIDIILSLEEKMINWNLIKDQLENLHDMVWKVFSTSLSQKYENLLNGELL